MRASQYARAKRPSLKSRSSTDSVSVDDTLDAKPESVPTRAVPDPIVFTVGLGSVELTLSASSDAFPTATSGDSDIGSCCLLRSRSVYTSVHSRLASSERSVWSVDGTASVVGFFADNFSYRDIVAGSGSADTVSLI